jgi:hypothetical protein
MYWAIGCASSSRSGGDAAGSTTQLSANGTKTASRFSIELLPNNRMLIKGPNGLYLKGQQNGSISCSAVDSRQATQWEF